METRTVAAVYDRPWYESMRGGHRPPLQWLLSVAAILALAGCDSRSTAAKPDRPELVAPPRKGATLVVPVSGAYTGAYIAGDVETITEDDVQLENIEAFEAEVGKHQAIIAFSSYWGEQTFPHEAVQIVGHHGSVPLIFWSPWDRPYLENKGPDRFRLDAILAGKWDAYIDKWADAARDFGAPLMVSFCNEMNGNWFPWSGAFYGASDPAPGSTSTPPLPAGPEFFKKAYRYIVDRVRTRGATNVLWIFHVNNFSEPVAPWNAIANYYPGPGYADWLGISVYGQQFPSNDPRDWKDFDGMSRAAYDALCRLDPDKPIMITEWGVGEFPKHGDRPGGGGDKAQWFQEAFNTMRLDYPRLRAAIYWNERWQNSGGGVRGLYSNLRVASSPQSLAAYRKAVALPFWLGEPIYR